MAGRVRPETGGITSACAEQTSEFILISSVCQDHLRVCGADGPLVHVREPLPGSPPRVRSRRSTLNLSGRTRGITSACAEQTHAIRDG